MAPGMGTHGHAAQTLVAGDEGAVPRLALASAMAARRPFGSAGLRDAPASASASATDVPDATALLDLAQDAIVVCDMQDRVLLWSRGAEAMYGWPKRDALGRSMQLLLQSQFFEPVDHLEAVLLEAGRWEGEVVQQRRDGAPLTVATRWTLQRDAAGAPVRILSITNDITAHKQAEAELIRLTERLSLATAVAKVGVWEWDLETDVLTWDDTTFAIHGRPFVAGLPYDAWLAVIHPEDRPLVATALQKVIEDKGQGAFDYRIAWPDGSGRTLSTIETVGLDAQGRARRVVGVTMDVTERRVAAAALEQARADQLRVKDDFLCHVSHELRSPLTAIRQFTSILLGGLAGDLTAEQRQYQQIVLKNSRQLQSMIDDLLEVTRLENGRLTVEPRSLSVADAVTDCVSTLHVTARTKGVGLLADLPLDLPLVFADDTRLRQILIILLDNAIKFTPGGGAVHIEGRVDPDDAGAVRVTVSDTGCGIAPELSSRVFERLYQAAPQASTSRKGLGLGLHICRELVTLQGGRITVGPGPDGVGSTFAFTVPIVSLEHSLAPLFRDGRWPASSLAVVTVSARVPAADRPPDRWAEWVHEARVLVQRCLAPDRHVLLPRSLPARVEERFVVAAFTDDAGAAALASRVAAAFARMPVLMWPGMTVSVAHHMAGLPAADGVDSTETPWRRMAGYLAGSLESAG